MKRFARIVVQLSNRSGAVAVEFALVIVPFLIIVFGIMQVAFTFGLMATLNEAATETARTLQLEFPLNTPALSDADREARARFKGPDPSRLIVLLEPTAGGQILRLAYDVPLFLPIFDWSVARVHADALVLP